MDDAAVVREEARGMQVVASSLVRERSVQWIEIDQESATSDAARN